MKKKSKNIFFIIITIILISSIIIFNYKVDPLEFNNIPKYQIYNDNSPENLILRLKLTKDRKYENVLICSSTSNNLFSYEIIKKYKIAKISESGLSLKELYEIIVAYFTIHEETKTLILPIEYSTFFNLNNSRLKSFNKKNIKKIELKELIQMYCSINTTIKSINFLSKKKEKNINEEDTINIISQEDINTNFFFVNSKAGTIQWNYNFKEENEYYINLIFDFLRKKEIKIITFIPPFHCLYSINPYKKQEIDKINFLLELILNYTNYIYDFSILNKYTTQSLQNESYLYSDISHPNKFYGALVIPILFNEKGENFLYKILTKENINEELNKKDNEIKNYINEKKDIINTFFSYNFNNNSNDFNYQEIRYYKNIPKEIIDNYNNVISEKKE